MKVYIWQHFIHNFYTMPTIGLNLRVTTDSKQGGRKYMEDVLSVQFEKGQDGQEIEFAYFAVFDGHGGPEAAKFAKQHLLGEITKNKGFWTDDDVQVMKAIRDGFITTHKLMWKVVGTWAKTSSGMPSTAGSTASVVFIRNHKMYVAHVGDSSVVLGIKDHGDTLRSHMITVDHKPESPVELARIEKAGGRVVAKAGVQRVVWNRTKPNHIGPIRRSTHIDHIPFLAVARSLGDMWSYNSQSNEFVVSPDPDVCTYKLDVNKHKCVILASDGLWNMVSPSQAVAVVNKIEMDTREAENSDRSVVQKPAAALVQLALDRWEWRALRADNTSVIAVMFDPPGISKTPLRHQSSSSSSSTVQLSDREEQLSPDLPSFPSPERLELKLDERRESGPVLAPFSPLTECRPSDNRFNCKLHVNRFTPKHQIYRGRPRTPNSAPAKLVSGKLFRPVAGFAGSILHKNKLNKDESVAPTAKTEESEQKDAAKDVAVHDNIFTDILKEDALSVISESVPVSDSAPTEESDIIPLSVESEAVEAKTLTPAIPTNVSPKTATCAKSPLKVDTTHQPSRYVISPVWPSSLAVGMEVEVASNIAPLPLTDSSNTEGRKSVIDNELENLQHPNMPPCYCSPTKQGIKRKAPPPSPTQLPVKRLHVASGSPSFKTRAQIMTLRTRSKTPQKV